MSNVNRSITVALGVDSASAESNLARFAREFKSKLTEIGAEPGDLAFFAQLQRDIDAGKVGLADYDQRTRALIQTFKEGRDVAAARDFLGVPAHADVQAEIQKTRAAYETLAASGKLTGAELAQAAQATQARIAELTRQTYDWRQALSDMKGELAVAGAAIYGVVRSLGAAAGASAQFQQAMSEVGTLMDDTSGLDGMAEAVRRLAREYGGDVSANAKALYDIVSAGATDSAQALGVLDAANRLAVAGVSDVGIAADGLTSAMNAYGDAAGSASDVSDSFFTAVRAGKTTVEELSGSIGGVAPVAAAAGVSLDELLASTAALTAGGLGTSEAMTAIKSAVASVIKPSSEARKLAEDLGLEFNASALQAKGFAGFLEDIRQKTGGNIEVMGKLFGSVEGLNGVLTLTGAGAEKFTETLEQMAEKAGQTDTAVAKMMDGPAARSARFKAAMADVQLSVGDAVTAFSPLLEAATSTLNAFNSLSDGTKTVIAGTGALAVALPPLVLAMSSLVKAAGILRTALIIGVAAKVADTTATVAQTAATEASTAAIVRQTAALRLLRLAMIGTGVGALIVAAGALGEKLAGAADASETLADNLPTAADAAPVAALATDTGRLADSMQSAAAGALANKEAIAELAEAMGKLGLNLAEVDAAFDGTESNALAAFDVIAGNAATTGEVLFQSLHAALGRVSGDEGFEKLRRAASDAFAAGRLSAEQYEVVLDSIGSKQQGLWQGLDETVDAVDRLVDAYERLGITSSQSLRETERQVRADYDTLVRSGVEIRDQTAGWTKWAEAAIAANGGVADSSLAAEAAQRGYILATDDAGKTVLRLKDLVKESGEQTVDEIGRANQELAELQALKQRADELNYGGIGTLSSSINDFHERLQGLGDAVGSNLQAAWARVHKETSGNLEVIQEMQRVLSSNVGYGTAEGIGKYLGFVNEQVERITATFREQIAQRDEWVAMLSDGAAGLRELSKVGETAQATLHYLSEEDLAPLRRAIADAESRMLGLRDAASDTLSTIQDEWDQLNNNLDEVEKRRQDKRRAEVEAQLAAARASGDRESIANLEKSLSLLKQIADVRIKDAKAREDEVRERGKLGGAPSAGTEPRPGPGTTHLVKINLGGSVRSVNVASAQDAATLQHFLRDLESSMRSTA